MQKDETRPLSYTIHKNTLKMDKGPECETGNHRNPRGESRKKPLWPQPQQFLTWHNSKGKGIKSKNELLGPHEDTFFFNVYLLLREERDRARAGDRQREGETQNLKQAPGSELSAQSQTQDSNSQMARPWPEPKSEAQLTEPPRCLFCKSFLKGRYSFVDGFLCSAEAFYLHEVPIVHFWF